MLTHLRDGSRANRPSLLRHPGERQEHRQEHGSRSPNPHVPSPPVPNFPWTSNGTPEGASWKHLPRNRAGGCPNAARLPPAGSGPERKHAASRCRRL